MPELFNPSLIDPKVHVIAAMDRLNFRITWPAAPGVDGYRLYAGFDPLHIRSLISGVNILPAAQTELLVQLPFVPPNQIVYFWVASVIGDVYTFIEEYGSYTFT